MALDRSGPLPRFLVPALGALAIVFGLLPGPAARATPRLDAPVLHESPSPWSVLALDLDGDAETEIVVGTETTIDLHALDDSGALQLERRFSVAQPAVEIRAADLGGSSVTDLVVLHRPGNRVSVILDAETLLGPFPAGPAAAALALGDIDGDGSVDAITANQTDGSCSILLGDGAGSFGEEDRVPGFQIPWGIALADIQGDGALDLIVSDYGQDMLVVIEGGGDGTFGARHETPLPAGPIEILVVPSSPSGADLFVACRRAAKLVRLRGDGAFGWSAREELAIGRDPFDLALGNFGNEILVCDAQDAHVRVVRLGTAMTIEEGAVSQVSARACAATTVGDRHLLVSVLPPLVSGESSGWICVHARRPDGSGAGPIGSAVSALEPAFGDVGDIDGDGRPDWIVGARTGSSAEVLAGTGTGSFRGMATVPIDGGATDLSLISLDGDDSTDLAVTRRSASKVALFRGDGAFGFQRLGELTTPGQPVGVAAARLDADAYADLVVTCAITDSVAVWKGSAGGAAQRIQAFRAGRLLGAPSLVDIDADGEEDLAYVEVAAGGAAGALVVHRGAGDGTFGAALSSAAGDVPASVHFARLDEDGFLDAVVASVSRRQIRTFFGVGDGTFRPGVADTSFLPPGALALADLDEDGAPELLVAGGVSNRVLVRKGEPGGAFGAPEYLDCGRAPFRLFVSDANEDGRQDVLVLREGAEPLAAVLQTPRFPNVSLWSFAASNDLEGVRLRWTADIATPNVSFRVERRAGMKALWQSVADSIAAGGVGLVESEVVDTQVPEPGWYEYRLAAEAAATTTWLEFLLFQVGTPPTDLVRAVPSPFQTNAEIRFILPGAGAPVRLEIFDAGGRRVRLLADRRFDPGENRMTWDGTGDRGSELPSGVYFVAIRSPGFTRTLRLPRVR